MEYKMAADSGDAARAAMVSLLLFPASPAVTGAGYTGHITMLKYLLILLLANPLPLLAASQAEPGNLEPLPELPPPPLPESSLPAPTGVEEDELEPEVKIYKRNDAIIHEYRINGRLYMVKVVTVTAHWNPAAISSILRRSSRTG